jgi:hypothetical protein
MWMNVLQKRHVLLKLSFTATLTGKLEKYLDATQDPE